MVIIQLLIKNHLHFSRLLAVDSIILFHPKTCQFTIFLKIMPNTVKNLDNRQYFHENPLIAIFFAIVIFR